MAWFRCFARGESFPIFEGKRGMWGFYTTRYVEATDAEDAELKALELLRNEPALQVEAGTPGVENAKVFFEEIEQVDRPGAPNAGFRFFAEEP
jgi:hypothetical protein